MAIRFCTFGTEPNYTNSIRVLVAEAEESGYFDSIRSFNQHDLKLNRKHLDFMRRTRGFGFWSWKPLVVALTMLDSEEGDVIVYADAGCGISNTPIAKRNFEEWVEMVRAHPNHRLTLQMTIEEEAYTKADAFHALGCPGEEFRNTGQHVATIFFLMNTRENRTFVGQWMNYCIEDGCRLVSDYPSQIRNPAAFKDHRHDQSLFSLLIKKHGAAVIPDDWLSPDMPIVALRRRVRMNFWQKCRMKMRRRSLKKATDGYQLYEGPVSPVFLNSLAALVGSCGDSLTCYRWGANDQ